MTNPEENLQTFQTSEGKRIVFKPPQLFSGNLPRISRFKLVAILGMFALLVIIAVVFSQPRTVSIMFLERHEWQITGMPALMIATIPILLMAWLLLLLYRGNRWAAYIFIGMLGVWFFHAMFNWVMAGDPPPNVNLALAVVFTWLLVSGLRER